MVHSPIFFVYSLEMWNKTIVTVALGGLTGALQRRTWCSNINNASYLLTLDSYRLQHHNILLEKYTTNNNILSDFVYMCNNL